MKTKFKRLVGIILTVLIFISMGVISPTSVQGSTTSEIVLFEGWNLISLPFTPEDSSIEVVLSDILDNVESVWTFDGESKTWSSYSPGAPSDLTEMVEDKGYWIKVNTDATLIIREASTKPIIVAQIKGALEADTALNAIMDNITCVDWVVVTGDISMSDLNDAVMLITVLSDIAQTYTEAEVKAIIDWLDECGKTIWICGDSDYGTDYLRIDTANSLLEDIGSVLRIDHASVEDPISNAGAGYRVLSITDNISPEIDFLAIGVERALTHGPGLLTAYADDRYWNLEYEQPDGVYVILTTTEAGQIYDHNPPEPESVEVGDEGSFVTLAMEYNFANGNFVIVESEAPFGSYLGMYYPEMIHPDRYGPDANLQQGGKLFVNLIDFFLLHACN